MTTLRLFTLLCALAIPTATTAKPLKVFILAGQSNMEGKGLPTHLDTYKDDPLIKPWYDIIKDGDDWAVREDVFITYPTKHGGPKHSPLTVDYGTKGGNSIGPEFGFGHAVGEFYEEPVLIIKTAWGGKSVYQPFRPPSAQPTDAEIRQIIVELQQKYDAAIEANRRQEAEGKKTRKPKPVPGFDELKASYGEYYRKMIQHVKEELADYENKFPELKGTTPELAGFVWHQGFNDKVAAYYKDNETGYSDYTKWTAALIKDVRKDLNAPNLPVVIGELGTDGVEGRGPFQEAQANIAKLPDFRNTVVFVPTAQFQDKVALQYFEEGLWKKGPEGMAKWMTVGNDRPYHYLGSGKTYFLKGVAFAEAISAIE
ncbi:sialate O-acetylesterase [Haloferula sp. A504]|uniref:sialate O-acetylesterase n=1 Tax=Haloferula sp. A504 TaxID=3373601 RepID=UPI0031C0174B|nr:sialate O-acetylesterase [Verrucomicrobiaceae bacterium E54]